VYEILPKESTRISLPYYVDKNLHFDCKQ